MTSGGLYIPKKLRVGFQKRADTYTKRLAYVICYGEDGKLRSEKSWEGWRDTKIEPEEFDNVPHEGFILNKNIERYGWSHYGSGRSVIRIYDTRGIEFEISPENLMGILMHTTCSRRSFEGKFVYAWKGAKPILLPVASEEYQKASAYTERLGKKVTAKELTPGFSYTTKKGEELVYIGRFLWHYWNFKSYRGEVGRTASKQHVFMRLHPKGPERNSWGGISEPEPLFFVKKDAGFLATMDSEAPLSDFADRLDQFKNDRHSSTIIGFEKIPLALEQLPELLEDPEADYPNDRWKLNRKDYYDFDGKVVSFYQVSLDWERSNDDRGYALKGYNFARQGRLDTQTLLYQSDEYRTRDSKVYTKEQLLEKLSGFGEVDMLLEGGGRQRIMGDYYSLGDS